MARFGWRSASGASMSYWSRAAAFGRSQRRWGVDSRHRALRLSAANSGPSRPLSNFSQSGHPPADQALFAGKPDLGSNRVTLPLTLHDRSRWCAANAQARERRRGHRLLDDCARHRDGAHTVSSREVCRTFGPRALHSRPDHPACCCCSRSGCRLVQRKTSTRSMCHHRRPPWRCTWLLSR